jgi:ketosteroid isomerase-like protein
MSDADDIRALAHRFFDAVEAGDLDAVRAIYAPDAVIWHNDDGKETSVADNLKVLAGFIKHLPVRRYENRRVDVFPGGFAEQHVLKLERGDGRRFELAACIICRVQDGRITRLDEYFDSAAVKALSAP